MTRHLALALGWGVLISGCGGHAVPSRSLSPTGNQSCDGVELAGDSDGIPVRLEPAPGRSLPSGTPVWWVFDAAPALTLENADRTRWRTTVDENGLCRIIAPSVHGRGTGYLSWWTQVDSAPILIESGMYDGFTPHWFVEEGGEVVPVPPADGPVDLHIKDHNGRALPQAFLLLTVSLEGAPHRELAVVLADAAAVIHVKPLTRGFFCADVVAPGFAPVRIALHQGPNAASPSTMRVTLVPAATLTVRVHEADGAPVSGRRVFYEYEPREGDDTTRYSVLTDASGIAWFDAPRGKTVRCSIPGWASGSAAVRLADEESEQVVTFRREGSGNLTTE